MPKKQNPLLQKQLSKLCGGSNLPPTHTVAICTFTFQKIYGFVRVILKSNFKQFHRPKVSTFLIWKFQFIICIFLLFLAKFVKSTAFCTLLLLFQNPKSWHVWIAYWVKNHNLYTGGPPLTRFPLTRFPLTQILAYVRVSGGISVSRGPQYSPTNTNFM